MVTKLSQHSRQATVHAAGGQSAPRLASLRVIPDGNSGA